MVVMENTLLYKTMSGAKRILTFGLLTVIFYVIIIAIVWAFAFWDATNVLKDYHFNNRVTFVKTIEIPNGPNDFIEDTMVCVGYKNSIFELIWWDDAEEVRKEINDAQGPNGTNLTRQVFKEMIPILSTDGIPKLTKRQYIHALKIIRMVRDMDACQRSKWLANNLNYPCPQIETYWTDQQLDKLNDTLWTLFNDASTKSNHSTLIAYSLNEICHLIDVRKVFTDSVEETRIPVPIGLLSLYDGSEIQPGGNQTRTTKMQQVKAYFPATVRWYESNWNPNWLTLSLQMLTTARGVYDRRNLSSPCFGDRVPQYEMNCRYAQYVKMVEEYCHCIPYKFQNTREKEKGELHYCGSEDYTRECMENVLNALANYSCEHCLTTQNTYEISSRQFAPVDNIKLAASNASISISFMGVDKFYARFEETTKNSLSQVVAQVGGDVGFYTGFSVWALWKFLIFLINTLKIRQYEANERKRVQKIDTPARPNVSWFKIAMDYLAEGDERFLEARKESELVALLNREVQRLEAKVEMLETLGHGTPLRQRRIFSETTPDTAVILHSNNGKTETGL